RKNIVLSRTIWVDNLKLKRSKLPVLLNYDTSNELIFYRKTYFIHTFFKHRFKDAKFRARARSFAF
ncbi:MAG TPA: hypothetical protein PLT95_07495, partial [Agitococcus sp.]|nr:hypothetical protein [Agitococcus sp.]